MSFRVTMRVVVDGYAWLQCSELESVQLEWLKRQLTLVQSISKEYKNRAESAIVRCFVEDALAGKIGIAREFFFERVTKTHDISYDVSNGEDWPDRLDPEPSFGGFPPFWAAERSDNPKDLTFYDTEKKEPVSLRDEQKSALSAAVSHLSSRPASGGIIQAPTGWGKTVFALSLIKELKVKTAVLVHRKFLMDQWRKRINRFLPDAKVGCIYGNKWDVDGCHVVLVMIETIASWVKNDKVRPELAKMFGLVISDEVHRTGAPQWSQAITRFHAAKRVGISARPKRSDKLDKCFFYHIGPKIFAGQEFQLVPKVRRVWTRYKIDHPRFNPDFMSLEFMLRFMTKSAVYNQSVVEQILLALEAGRKILVYSHQLEHLRRLKEGVDAQWKGARAIKTDYFIGGMTEEELLEAETADVIFATYMMAKDSLDIPPLDTVVLATPVRDPEQPGGRCLRPFQGKKDPVIVDMRADEVPVCKDYGKSRDKAYERLYSQPAPKTTGSQ